MSKHYTDLLRHTKIGPLNYDSLVISSLQTTCSNSVEPPRSIVPPARSHTSAKRPKPHQTMRGHWSSVEVAAHLYDGQHIITCSNDGSLRLWDLESGAQIGNEWRDGDDTAAVCTMALSPNGKTVASGSYDRIARLWDLETEKVITKWTASARVLSVYWSADGNHVLTGSYGGLVSVWDVKSRETVLGIKTGHKEVYAVIYSPDETKIATGGSEEDAVKIWDAKIGKLLYALKHNSVVYSLAWTSNQKKLISASSSIKIFDTTTWQQTAILEGHESAVHAISLFQNNRLLASASWDHTTRLWDLDTNLQVGPSLQHEAIVNNTAFSADGKLLVTACWDNDAYVWDIYTILKVAGLPELLSIPRVRGQRVW
jgi:WD40 repeat protein